MDHEATTLELPRGIGLPHILVWVIRGGAERLVHVPSLQAPNGERGRSWHVQIRKHTGIEALKAGCVFEARVLLNAMLDK